MGDIKTARENIPKTGSQEVSGSTPLGSTSFLVVFS